MPVETAPDAATPDPHGARTVMLGAMAEETGMRPPPLFTVTAEEPPPE
jgi:hypothetical protein